MRACVDEGDDPERQEGPVPGGGGAPGRGEGLTAANRAENPARRGGPPLGLLDSPRLVGGRARVAGGTWMGVRAPTPHSGRAAGEASL